MSMATNISLCAVPVFFATSEGQTQKIAGRFAAVLRHEGIASATYDVSDLAYAVIDWTAVRGAIVCDRSRSLKAGNARAAEVDTTTARDSTGSAVHGLHRDIWFGSSDDGWTWQRSVGQAASIEILP